MYLKESYEKPISLYAANDLLYSIAENFPLLSNVLLLFSFEIYEKNAIHVI